MELKLKAIFVQSSLTCVVSRTTKLHGRPIRKFDVKMLRLICTICSKTSMSKDIHDTFFANDWKFIKFKELKRVLKQLL